MAHVTKQRMVAVLGATGTVGQRFISLLADHPWFKLTALTTSDRSAGKRYADAVHWHLPAPMPESVANMKLEPTRADVDADLCFSALPTDAAQEHEAALAKAGHHVFSNASTHRMDADVPNLLAEVNFDHVKALRLSVLPVASGWPCTKRRPRGRSELGEHRRMSTGPLPEPLSPLPTSP
jgi:aspartate-semialdehyde dehydrogenase